MRGRAIGIERWAENSWTRPPLVEMTQGKYSLHADCQANTLVACAEKSGSHSLLTKWLASGVSVGTR